MTISSDDQNRYRGGFHSTKAVVNLVPKIVAGTAQINQTAFSYPLAQLSIDGLSTIHTLKGGYMFMIGTSPGAWDVTVGVIKSVLTDTMYIDAKSQGDPGYSRSIITPLADNQYITILKFRPAFGLLSSIRAGVFYKNWDIPYRGQGTNPDPVPVFGGWRQYFAPAGGHVTIPLDSSESWAWGQRTIASRLWNLDGGSVNTGTLTDETLTADFEPGFYELEVTVRDNLDKARTGYRYMWVNVDNPADDNAPFNYRNPCQIVDDKQTAKGREIGLQFGKNLTEIDELFPGQGFLVSEFPRFNGELLDGDSFVGTFAGYQTDSSKTASYKKRQTTINIKSPVNMADSIPAATQELNEVANPSNWAECAKVLSNPVGAAWYVAAHHAPYLIDGHDFTYDSALLPLRRQTFQFKATNIGGQLKTVSDMGLCAIGNKSNGRLRMVRNPLYMRTDERNALETLFTYTPRDIVGELTKVFYSRNGTGQVFGYAFGYDGSGTSTPYQSLAPGYERAQADGQQSMTPFIVVYAGLDGQIRVNEITGHEFARQNKAPNYSFTVNRNLDFVEPIDVDVWYSLDVPATYDSEGFGWINERMIPVSITRTWAYDGAKLIKKIDVEWEPESFGVPGITIPVDRGGANNWWVNNWNPALFDPYSPVMPKVPGLVTPVMLGLNSNGLLARTFTFSEPQLSWQKLPVPAGTPAGFALDYFSGYFSDPTGAIQFYIVTRTATQLHIYRLADARRGAPKYVELTGSPITASTVGTKSVQIRTSRSVQDFVFVTWRELDGVHFVRTTAFDVLSSPAHIGSTLSGDSAQLAEPLGADVVDNVQAVIAPNGGTTTDGKHAYGLYIAQGVSASFSPYTGNPLPDESAVLGFCKLSPAADLANVSYIIPDPPSPPADMGVVTFDMGGETDFTVLGAGVTSGGHPNNAAYNSFNADGAGGSVGVSVLCNYPKGQYNIIDIEFDTKPLIAGSVVDFTEAPKVEAFAGGLLVGSGVPTLRENYGDGYFRLGIRPDELKLSEPPEIIKITYGYNFSDSSPTTIVYAYIDNIVITGTPIDLDATRTMYSVNVSADSWADITPAGAKLGMLPFSLGDYFGYSLLATADNGKVYLLNSSGGSSWSTVGRSPYSGLVRSHDFVLAWGTGLIAISPDAGATFYPRLGDWASKIGAMGEFIQLGGVL